jgi:glucose/arabinose dehydrogenase
MPTFNGDATANTLNGSNIEDLLDGQAGNDRLYGGGGVDVIFGGAGDDAIYGYGQFSVAGDGVALTATRVAAGLQRPVFATFAPSSQEVFYNGPAVDTNRLFIVEAHTGQIEILDLTTNALRTTPFLDIPDAELSIGGEEGLLGLAFHPQYASNGRFYVQLVNAAGNIEVREYSSSIDPDVANPNGNVILTIPHPTFSNHNGGWMGFGPDGMLYLAIGDGGSGGDPNNNAQNLNSLLGKILRVDVNTDAFPSDPDRDFAIPSDNPFAGATAGVDEIWAFGLRNPWRNSFDAATGELYIADVGQDVREEINVQSPGVGGRNYGWRILPLCQGSCPALPFWSSFSGGGIG